MTLPTPANELTGLKICSLDFSVVHTLDLKGLMYYSKYSNIVALQQIFQDQSETFFNIFGGTSVKLPNLSDEEALENSHIPEIGGYFGREAVEQLYFKFGEGATIEIPSSEQVRNVLIDLIIYTNVKSARDEKRRVLAKKLSEQYNVPLSKINFAYKKVLEGAGS